MNSQNPQSNFDSSYKSDAQASMGGAIFIMVAVIAGIAIALLIAGQQRRKPKTFREKLEYNFGKGGEATAHALKQLSKDIDELRKSVEDRIESMR